MDDSSVPIPAPDEPPSGDPAQPPVVPGPSADVPAAPLVGLQYNLGEGMRVYNARDITIAPASPPPPPEMRTLPRDVAAFTGRDAEVRHLLTAAALSTGIVAIHAVDGMPGVGKTALAVHVAHLLAADYPDGQLFVDLYTHTPGIPAADPAETLGRLLARTGMDPRHIPDDLGERAARWRSRLAGKKMLLILDDASGPSQVDPLLPGTPGSLVLITSRSRMIGLDGAEALPLAPLPPEQATALFTRLAGRGPLTGADAAAVTELVQLCGHLPLAIALMAGRIAHRHAWPLHTLAAEFAAAENRLGELEAGDRAVRTVFDMSYQHLPADRQRLYRHLGLHPGPDIDAYAAAALADIPLAQARRELEALYADHLLDETAPSRYRLHDLLRAYTHDLATTCDTAGQREQATERLLAHYTRTAQAADQYLNRTSRPSSPPATSTSGHARPDLADRDTALAWMRTEHHNLLACLDHATTHSQHRPLIDLTAAMAAYLRQEGPWQQAATLHHTAATAARHQHDPAAEANALHHLADIRRLTGEYAQAADLCERALALYEQLGNQLGQANALQVLGQVRLRVGEYAQAADLSERALALYAQLGDRLGQANALQSLGQVWRMAGEYAQAADLSERALALSEQLGDGLGQADALRELGQVRRVAGEYAQAADLSERALALYAQLGDRLGQANALQSLGQVRRLAGQYAQAADLSERALALYEQLGDRLGQATALRELGQVRRVAGEYAQAADLSERALALYAQLGDRLGQANALQVLGQVRRLAGQYAQAADLSERALALYAQLGDRLGQANALKSLGQVRRLAGEYAQAADLSERALALYAQLGDRLGQANALQSLGQVRRLAGQYAQAADLSERALALYEQFGNRHGQANAVQLLGCVHTQTGDHLTAADLLARALSLFRQVGDRQGEAETLNYTGDLLSVSAGPEQAARVYRQALDLAQQVDSPLDEAHALDGIARCAAANGNRDAAVAGLRQAVALYQRLGVSEATTAAEYLATLEPGNDIPTAS
ncbi:tetratricopeptide repeat protein [Nonomuraea sp. NPDC001831]|uniref:tetratricopeptide repeat protein n=1 Tax=Nonomuraea sp. NPDC001831 TaxID=3364340 RepID=UPI00368903F2